MNAIDLAAKNIVSSTRQEAKDKKLRIRSIHNYINDRLKWFEYELTVELGNDMFGWRICGLDNRAAKELNIMSIEELRDFFYKNEILDYYEHKGFTVELQNKKTRLCSDNILVAIFRIDPNYKPPLWRRILSWFY